MVSPSSGMKNEASSVRRDKFPTKIPRGGLPASTSSSEETVNFFSSASFSDSKHDSRLAFTKDELEFSKNDLPNKAVSSYSFPTQQSLTQGNVKPKKRFVPHGIMKPSTGDLVEGRSRATGFNSLTPDTASSAPVRARQTVTTILRQQHALEKAEKLEREKLDSLMNMNTAHLEVDSHSKELERRKEEETKAAEAKRLLQARLAYEKAIAASRKVANEKQKLAESTRQKEMEWKSMLEAQKCMEKERLKAMTEALQKANKESKRAFDEMLRSKQVKAIQVKQETEQLQAEARQKQEAEELRRQDKIQQIQASKQALKKTKENLGNPKQFYRSIAIPETQIKLRLKKEEDSRKLEETRQKIQAQKQMKSVKLIRAMKKIQSCEVVSRQQRLSDQTDEVSKYRPSTFPVGSLPMLKTQEVSVPILAAKKDQEISQMLQQLQQLRAQNHQKKVAEKSQLNQAATNGRTTVKIIGVK